MRPLSGEGRIIGMGNYAGHFGYKAKGGTNLAWLDSFAVPWGTQAIVELEWTTDSEIKLALDQARQGMGIILFIPAFRMATSSDLAALKDAGIDPGISVFIREIAENGHPIGIPFQLTAEKTWIESLQLVENVVRIHVGLDGAKVTQEMPPSHDHGHHHRHGYGRDPGYRHHYGHRSHRR